MAITTVLTNGGIAALIAALNGSGLGAVYLSLGTGSGTAAVTDTALTTEDATTGRTAATKTPFTVTVANDSLKFIATPTTTVSSETVTELGLWTASSGGTLIARSTGYSQPFGTASGTSSATFEIDLTL